MKKLFAQILIIAPFLFLACNNDDDAPPPQNVEDASVNLSFNFKVGDELLDLGSSTHILAGEDTIRVNQFKFIFSNFRLYRQDGTSWQDEDGYYLVKATEGSSTFDLMIDDVPAGDYTSMEFYIGMDSAMNFKPEDFPILFQQEGMYWDWNTGYKFLLLEGDYFSTSLGIPGDKLPFIAHIGDMINLEIPQFSFVQALSLTSGSEGELNLEIDLGKIYTSPNRLPLNDQLNRNVMGGPKALLIAENYGEGMIQLME